MRIFPEDPKSKLVMDRIRNWLRECTWTHTHPKPPVDPILPRRIIDVGYDESENRIIEDPGLGVRLCAIPLLYLKENKLRDCVTGLPVRSVVRDGDVVFERRGIFCLSVDSRTLDWLSEVSRRSIVLV